MNDQSISLLYTTARPHLIEEVIGRWLGGAFANIEMIVVTDELYNPPCKIYNCKYVVNEGRRDCVTGWNLAAENSIGSILVQVSDDLYPPPNWDSKIRSLLKNIADVSGRDDLVLNLLDERRQQDAVFHPVLTRAAYEKNSYLYPRDFQSMYCDNWFFLFHKKYSVYAVSQDVFWSHRHRTTHQVEIDWVTQIHEGAERYQSGLQILNKYIVEHNLL